MSGLLVKCPQCKRVMFETTDKYRPNVPPNGSMVRFLRSRAIDWLCTSGTKASEMTCPECLGQLAHTGKLLVVEPAPVPVEDDPTMPKFPPSEEIAEDITTPFTSDGNPARSDKYVYICPECGKECKSQFGLNSHIKSHGGKK